MVSYRVVLDVPRDLILFVPGLLAAHRREIGTRKGTRRLGRYRQALFGLAWFRDRDDISCFPAMSMTEPPPARTSWGSSGRSGKPCPCWPDTKVVPGTGISRRDGARMHSYIPSCRPLAAINPGGKRSLTVTRGHLARWSGHVEARTAQIPKLTARDGSGTRSSRPSSALAAGRSLVPGAGGGALMPNTCARPLTEWRSRWSRRCGERAVKPSAQPTLVRTQHLPPNAETAR